MIISKTPYRISFFGGGSDYPSWFNKYGGSVLSTTIDKHKISGKLLSVPFLNLTEKIILITEIENVKNIILLKSIDKRT